MYACACIYYMCIICIIHVLSMHYASLPPQKTLRQLGMQACEQVFSNTIVRESLIVEPSAISNANNNNTNNNTNNNNTNNNNNNNKSNDNNNNININNSVTYNSDTLD